MPEQPEPDYLDARDAAARLGIFETTFEGLAKHGIIPAGVRFSDRCVRWPRVQIEALKVLLPWMIEHYRIGKRSAAENLPPQTGNYRRERQKKRRQGREPGAGQEQA